MSDPAPLCTRNLQLSLLSPHDAADIHRGASDAEVAATTLTIPHPYPRAAADTFICERRRAMGEGKAAVFTLRLRDHGGFVGCMGLHIERRHLRAELGYWIAREQWNRGFATEAGAAVLQHGFDGLGLHRIYAHVFEPNVASRKVLEKLGMRHEGTLRDHIQKANRPVTLLLFALLRGEALGAVGSPPDR